ncbi:uncharacterized protein LOC119991722 isoform X2 [Tripterygium wilfordii]|uniref:uncharacterized protein LOC119991722 isoform X2 n=1 Tax=Tripterygium wilfordii TaxID=458696 RepID=UPI0018F7F370|nr:uncharacterized protein LOC119991722 isoform X2 [Tripterygium wilfordii]
MVCLLVMVKPKQRRGLHPSRRSTLSTDTDLYGEDSWIVVKKQRVTILIPPLPVAKEFTTPTPRPNQLQALSRKTVHDPIEVSLETQAGVPLPDEQEKSMAVAPVKGTHITGEAPAECTLTLAEQLMTDSRLELETPDQNGALKSLKKLSVFNSSKSFKRPRMLRSPCNLIDGGMLLNQGLRALNLERKLKNSGGLNKWLASLGLGQFVRIFHGKNVNKFQLANLTMKKLKDMGANAVGPRRKLMHAIDCISQPYCFEAI